MYHFKLYQRPWCLTLFTLKDLVLTSVVWSAPVAAFIDTSVCRSYMVVSCVMSSETAESCLSGCT